MVSVRAVVASQHAALRVCHLRWHRDLRDPQHRNGYRLYDVTCVRGYLPVGTTKYPAGTLLVSTGDSAVYAGATGTWTYTAISGSSGNIGGTGTGAIVPGTAASAPWIPYVGPGACANVS